MYSGLQTEVMIISKECPVKWLKKEPGQKGLKDDVRDVEI